MRWVNIILSLGIVAGCAAGCSNRSLSAENETLKKECARLSGELAIQKARNEDLIRSQPGLRDEEREEYVRRGLKNPVRDIIDDLGGREDMMPVKGMFGARPSFYKDVRMYLLNAKWVYATFDVGGSIGQRLYEYSVAEGGALRWKVIATWIVEK
jgi:hypothetical protein